MMSDLTRSEVPHSAVIRIQIKIHQQLKDGSLSPKYLSVDELNKLGIAPCAEIDNNGFKTHYIKFGRGELLDPLGADKGKHNRPYFDYKKVNQKVYAYYMQYLENRERIFLTRARRALMEIN